MQCFLPFFSMASAIIQVYLKPLLESFFNADGQLRMCALNVISLILKQGLVHPVQVSDQSYSFLATIHVLLHVILFRSFHT